MKQDEIRLKLIDGTIRVISKDGLEKATTKQIATQTSINEAYIYRCFADKDDLFAKVFDTLDEELVAKATQYISVMYTKGLPFEMRCRLYFSAIWSFMLGSKDRCLAFVRYYYSPYFVNFSAETHKKRYQPIVDTFKSAFKDEADVWMILNHILNVMLDFAVKVHNNQMPSEDNYVEHIFRVVYRSVEQYFKEAQGE